MSQTALFPEVFEIGQTGDPLDRFYTPPALASAATLAIRDQHTPTLGKPWRVFEAHVGDGAWVRAARQWKARSAKVFAVDLDPGARGLAADIDRSMVGSSISPSVLEEVARWRPNIVLGNPPFSDAPEHLKAIRAALPEASIAWILPFDIYSVGYWIDALEVDKPRIIRPIEGRPWPKSVRGCAVFEWWPRSLLYAKGNMPQTDQGAIWHTDIRPLRWK